MRLFKNIAFFLPIFLCSANAISQTRPIADSISAKSGANKTIVIEWKFPEKTEPKIIGSKLYRASKPISSYKDIEADFPIAVLTQTKHTDSIQKAGDYFYAVIAITPHGDYKAVISGVNATVRGAQAKVPEKNADEAPQAAQNSEEEIAESDSMDFGEKTAEHSKENSDEDFREIAANSDSESQMDSKIKKSRLPSLVQENEFRMREMPLPLPMDILGLGQEAHAMSEEAKQSVANLANGSTKKKPESFKTPYFFEDDMFAPDGGDGYILFETLREGLVQRKYRESVELFIDFLSVNRNAAVTNRAEFYLGESFYFCGEYKKAVQCFLAVQEIFPALAKKWIDSSLDLMEGEF